MSEVWPTGMVAPVPLLRSRAREGESEGMEAWRSSAYTLEEQGCVAAMVWVQWVPILG